MRLDLCEVLCIKEVYEFCQGCDNCSENHDGPIAVRPVALQDSSHGAHDFPKNLRDPEEEVRKPVKELGNFRGDFNSGDLVKYFGNEPLDSGNELSDDADGFLGFSFTAFGGLSCSVIDLLGRFVHRFRYFTGPVKEAGNGFPDTFEESGNGVLRVVPPFGNFRENTFDALPGVLEEFHNRRVAHYFVPA